MTDVPAVHPALEPIAFLIGIWEGTSEGLWVPDEHPVFQEQVVFGHLGKPYLTFLQRTWAAGGVPAHGEMGYLGISGERVTWTVAEPSGVVEVHAGSVQGTSISFECVTIGLGPDAKRVTGVRRHISVDGDDLTYRTEISMNDEELAPHIEGHLHRRAVAGG